MKVPLQKLHEMNVRQSVFSEYVCLKLQTWVLLIAIKTFPVSFGDAFPWLGLAEGQL